MSVVSLIDVKILNNPAPFNAPYQFEITFEAHEPLEKDLDWKLTYVGSAQSSEHDQELDSLLVGPVPPGVNKFVFEADPPSTANIPSSEIIGVTVILLTCAYDGREFVRIGYYVNNEYADKNLADNPPPKPVLEKIQRNILAEKPRVTRFIIKWFVDGLLSFYACSDIITRDSEATAPAEFPPDQPEADAAPDDEAAYGAEEVEAEAAETVLEGEGEANAGPEAEAAGEDAEMGGVEKDDAASEAGSEDIEGESSEDEDEEEEEEGDDEMEMDESAPGETAEHSAAPPAEAKAVTAPTDVMVH